MEKYNNFRDPGTGIQPFLDPKRLRTNESAFKTLSRYLKYSIFFPISIVKFLLISILFAVTFLLDNISFLFSPISFLKRFYLLLVYSIFRVILFLFGFYYIPTNITTLHKGARKPNANTRETTLKSGDIIIANHTSYIEILYFAFKYAPVFTHIGDNGSVERVSVWTALAQVGSMPRKQVRELKGDAIMEFSENVKLNNDGPIIIFPEGTTSNGRGLLKFLPVLNGLNFSKVRVQIFGLRYTYEEFSPTFTVDSKLIHAFWLSTQFINFMEVKQLPYDEIINPPASLLHTIAENSTDGNDVTAKISILLSQVLRLRRIAADRDMKCKFLQFHGETINKKMK
ncbi:hypothetical protein HK098_001334 [Nowakowskiella sp. JEL0407]|nr:hypothetical protein HK098_001334 [Nowakowskiella sp. JEL0407]